MHDLLEGARPAPSRAGAHQIRHRAQARRGGHAAFACEECGLQLELDTELGRPIEGIVEAQACDGYGEGGAQILSSGQVWLRTWSTNGSLRPERTVRIYASYLLP